MYSFPRVFKSAEEEFINSKILLDQYTYSLITVKDSDLAYELYLQLIQKKQNLVNWRRDIH